MAMDVLSEIEEKNDWISMHGENDLEVLMAKSELTDTRFVNQESLRDLLKNCKWVGTGYEFLWMAKMSRSREYRPGKGTVVLGLGEYYGVPQVMAEMVGGTDWEPKYGEYGPHLSNEALIASGRGVGPAEKTEVFMEKLLTDPKVTQVVMFVPE